jgi:cholesterol oxidase
MNYISIPVEQIKNEYDAIVIGSGYGGSIAASRLSRAGQKVCLLERGKEYAKGDFPEEELDASGEMQFDFPNKHVGSRLGLFDFRVNKDINALAGCGLGGTSLINASVSVLAEPRVYQQEQWPKAFRDDVDGLFSEGVELARKFLGANEYPENEEYPPLPKLDAMRLAADKMGEKCNKMDLNVTFKDGKNAFGFNQNKCTNCGDCVSGCNENAKNTTLMNYLPDAVNHGAEIITRVSVKYIEKKEDYWLVHFKYQKSGSDKFDGQTQFVKAKIVMLGAGSLGTTEILLRSKENGLDVSDKLGQRFTGNGDTTGFGYNTDHEINGIGLGKKARKQKLDKPGPCITSVIDIRGQENLHDGIVIEEGVVPGAISATMGTGLAAMAQLGGQDTDEGLADFLSEKWREIKSIVGGAYKGAVKNTITYLVNTHDDANGKMYLENDRMRIDWPGVGKQEVFTKVDEKLKDVTAGLGGTYIKNPLWSKVMGHDLITVHPLGGCSMGEDAGSGVVNHKGQVFDGNEGTNIHEGLYVCDGAVIPTALGANPLLTISGIAERTCKLLAEDKGWEIDYEVKPSITKQTHGVKPGLQFTESMKGYIQPTEDKELDYSTAYEDGKDKENYFEFVLTVISDDVEDMLENEKHEAQMTGTVKCQFLSPDPLTVTNGIFNLFVDDPVNKNTKLMKYGMNMTTEAGEEYYFRGFKSAHNDKGFDLWADTTTLFITINHGKDDKAPLVAKGMLKILPVDFMKQMTTMKVINGDNLADSIKFQAAFGKYFAGALFDTYGGIFTSQSYFNPDASPRKKRPLRVSAPEIHDFKTEDNLNLRLTRYQGGPKGPVILSHGLGVSSRIFAMDTYETNLVEYLFARNYDVWLLDYRASIELPDAANTQFSADEIAKYDYPAAVKTVQEITGAKTVQMVVHCFGSTSWTMSMLGGYLTNVRSAVVSQVSTHMKVPPLTKLKTGLHLPTFLDKLGIDSLTAYVDNNSKWVEKFFDDALRFYPIQKEERCDSPVCHRITFLYGQLYEHDQLNDETHEHLHEMFGVANIRSLEHLALLARKGHVVDFQGEETYLPYLERMAIPITFISGAENECFLPESTELTYNLLRERNGKKLYKRFVIPKYGHIDCIYGKNAARDVYPYILKQLEETN